MTILDSFILGLIQGISEFLPISSSGHLSIADKLMKSGAESPLAFNILLHVATLAAVFAVYYKDVWEMIKAFLHKFVTFTEEDKTDLAEIKKHIKFILNRHF